MLEVLTADIVEKVLDLVFPADNKSQRENFGELLSDLFSVGIFTADDLESFLRHHLEQIRDLDKEAAQWRLKNLPPSGQSFENELGRLQRGHCYSFTGLVRQGIKILEGLEYKDFEKKYIGKEGFAHLVNMFGVRRGKDADCPGSIFKYRTAKQTLLVLQTKKLAFSSPLAFNDPFDTQVELNFEFEFEELFEAYLQHFEEIVFGPEDNVPIDRVKGLARIFVGFRRIRDKLKLERGKFRRSCLPLVRAQIESTASSLRENKHQWKIFLNHLRVFCASSKFDSAPMWAHYGANHTGAVIELNSSLEIEGRSHHIERVHYTPEIPTIAGTQEWIKHLMNETRIDLTERFYNYAMHKHESWRYEEEWRVSYLKDSVRNGGLLNETSTLVDLVEISSANIRGLYLGLNMSKEDQTLILNVSRESYPHIRIFKAHLNYKAGTIEFDSME